jgi:uncharacterized protein involved in type VI secretion and phage assembly
MSPQNSAPGGNAPRFYGKYRGLVIENIDPEQIGRIMVQVPDVLGETPSSWAMPCVPAAGIEAGCFIVPPIGSQVWVEFEQGDPDYPIWTGGFWSTTGAMIVVNDTGIYISNGQGATITLIGPAVDVNIGGLTVI